MLNIASRKFKKSAWGLSTDQVHESGAGEPDADERGDELAQPDAVGSLENVEVLQHVGDGHQSQCSRKPQTCTAMFTFTLRSVSLDLLSTFGKSCGWRRSIVVRTLVKAGELSLSCARLLAGCAVKPSAIGQLTWPTQPAIPQGSVNE